VFSFVVVVIGGRVAVVIHVVVVANGDSLSLSVSINFSCVDDGPLRVFTQRAFLRLGAMVVANFET